MNFCARQHRFYWGVDLHARTLAVGCECMFAWLLTRPTAAASLGR